MLRGPEVTTIPPSSLVFRAFCCCFYLVELSNRFGGSTLDDTPKPIQGRERFESRISPEASFLWSVALPRRS